MANMTAKDRQQLATWLRGGATLDEVLSTPRFGHLQNERFSEAARRAYILLWTWTASRFGGEYGARQDKAFLRLRTDLFNRRIERAKAWADRFIGRPV